MTVLETGVGSLSDLPENVLRAEATVAEDEPSFCGGLRERIAILDEEWVAPQQPHYTFFATNSDAARRQVNHAIVDLTKKVTAMPCIVGENLRKPQIQQEITDQIARAFAVIADISSDNLNTCIEAGIARGARRPLHLIARAPRRRPPFMFRDQQVWHYSDNVELLGIFHRIIFPYRRRVINREMERRAWS